MSAAQARSTASYRMRRCLPELRTARKWARNATNIISATVLVLLVGLVTPPAVRADEAAAKNLLKAMSDYMAAQKVISFSYDTDLEIVAKDNQKLALASSGMMTLNRPDKLRAVRQGGFADVEAVFDGKTLTLFWTCPGFVER